jgi:hypothetical protein
MGTSDEPIEMPNVFRIGGGGPQAGQVGAGLAVEFEQLVHILGRCSPRAATVDPIDNRGKFFPSGTPLLE